MILTRALEHGWRQRADLHASLMVPRELLLALLDAVQAGRDVMNAGDHSLSGDGDHSLFEPSENCDKCDALAAWRKVVGE